MTCDGEVILPIPRFAYIDVGPSLRIPCLFVARVRYITERVIRLLCLCTRSEHFRKVPWCPACVS